MGYFDYTKEKDFLICIDSDGCAMDTMNSKHFNSFGPEFVKSYDLEEYKEEALEYWNKINLFTGNECMERALLWSIHVNLSIVEAQDNDMPFENVKEAMDELCKDADLTAVSSANGQAVEHEWTKHEIKDCCRVLLCQEAGSKAYCIEQLLKKGYDKDKVLMVGDAPGDKKAALDNGVRFYPIIVNKEVFSWKRLKEEASKKLFAGEFDDIYQAQLIKEFEEALGI